MLNAEPPSIVASVNEPDGSVTLGCSLMGCDPDTYMFLLTLVSLTGFTGVKIGPSEYNSVPRLIPKIYMYGSSHNLRNKPVLMLVSVVSRCLEGAGRHCTPLHNLHTDAR